MELIATLNFFHAFTRTTFIFPGSTAIQSIIYRYNHKKGKYLPFQRIRTNGARDCKFFKFDTAENGKEHYLAIANYGHEGN